MPALGCALASCFVFVAPPGATAYERLTFLATVTDSMTASRRSYIQLYGFADSACYPGDSEDGAFFLGAEGGTVRPLSKGWDGSGESNIVIRNGRNARICGLRIRKGSERIFEVSRNIKLEGGFRIRSGAGEGTRPLWVTNNSGIDLYDCIILKEGMVAELGDWPFGGTLKLPEKGGEFVLSYVVRRFDSSDRKERILGAFAKHLLRRLSGSGETHIVGWRRTSPAEPVPGYIQSVNLGEMWVVKVR